MTSIKQLIEKWENHSSNLKGLNDISKAAKALVKEFISDLKSLDTLNKEEKPERWNSDPEWNHH